MSFLFKIFGDANERYLKSARFLVDEINQREKEFEKFTNEEIKNKTVEFKERLKSGESLDQILSGAFALVREAAKRTIQQRPYDVQLIGGNVLHQGKIAEMKTGEGKTLTATLAVYLNALESKGTHVVTVNDYLSRRDTAWMGQIYDMLGLTVGCINHDTSYIYDSFLRNDKIQITHDEAERELDEIRDVQGSFRVVHEFLRPVTRREAYLADITYGTNNEFGFDYLRDNMVFSLEQKVQAKGHNFAMVDEVDSILIDEARTPLIISSPDSDSTKLYETFSRVVPSLKENEDYNVDEKLKAVSITESGIQKVEDMLKVGNIYEESGIRYVHHLEQALKAQILFKLDRDYVVKNGEVIIVDEFTGRLMPGRRWSDGLHQAVEAKEGVSVQKESRTMATITFQNYFRLYKKLSGMTGTAATSAEEFHKVYNLDVILVPPNKEMQRKDETDRIYKTENGKFKAIVEEIKKRHFGEEGNGNSGELNARDAKGKSQYRHRGGQPVLVGTVSIEKNELLSKLLEKENIPHKVLNAKNHEKEAEIIAQAGRFGAVTVATNMAGRGVDIILGGNPSGPEEAQKVKEVGGLHVLGTERHEARRIDNQLRGRAGRQGDPGSSQFFVSTEDDLARVFGGDRLKNMMERLGVGEDDVIENRFVSKALEQAQAKIEGFNFDARKYVLEYDDVMNRHRTAIYDLRNLILTSPSNRDLVFEYFNWLIGRLLEIHAQTETGEWNLKEVTESVKTLVNQEFRIRNHELRGKQELEKEIMEFISQTYQEKEKELGEEQMRRLENLVLLRVIDELWVDHLEAMEYLRESVRLRAYGQRDPLAEYKVEGQRMFEELLNNVKAQVANLIFKVGFTEKPKSVEMHEGRDNFASDKKEEKNEPVISKESQVGRNSPCPCGSGKKYKKCHGN